MGTRKDKSCRHAVKSCAHCTTGVYKKDARRKARRDGKGKLRGGMDA